VTKKASLASAKEGKRAARVEISNNEFLIPGGMLVYIFTVPGQDFSSQPGKIVRTTHKIQAQPPLRRFVPGHNSYLKEWKPKCHRKTPRWN